MIGQHLKIFEGFAVAVILCDSFGGAMSCPKGASL